MALARALLLDVENDDPSHVKDGWLLKTLGREAVGPNYFHPHFLPSLLGAIRLVDTTHVHMFKKGSSLNLKLKLPYPTGPFLLETVQQKLYQNGTSRRSACTSVHADVQVFI